MVPEKTGFFQNYRTELLSKCDQCWEEDLFKEVLQVAEDSSDEQRDLDWIDEVKSASAEVSKPADNIQLAECWIYSHLSREVTKETPQKASVYYLVNCFFRLSDIRARLDDIKCRKEIANDNAMLESLERKSAFINKVEDLVFNTFILLLDQKTSGIFYKEVEHYVVQPEEEKGTTLPIVLMLNAHNDDPDMDMLKLKLPSFYKSTIERINKCGRMNELVAPALEYISKRMRTTKITLTNPIQPHDVLAYIMCEPIIKLIPKLDSWCPEDIQRSSVFQYNTFLGPFLSNLSSYPEYDYEISKMFFPENSNVLDSDDLLDRSGNYIGRRLVSDIEVSTDIIRNMVDRSQVPLYKYLLTIIRSGDEAKEAVLNYIAKAITLNKSRTKLQSNNEIHQSDGFMHNLLVINLQLCEPIVEPEFSKIHLIDPHYILYSTRFNDLESVGINSSAKQRKEYTNRCRETHSNNPNFITEIFFLTLLSGHFGCLTLCQSYSTLIKQLDLLRKNVEKMKRDRNARTREGFADNPYLLNFYEKQLEALVCSRLCIDCMLKNKTFIQRMFRFYNMVMIWLIRCTLLEVSEIERCYKERTPGNINWREFATHSLNGLSIELPSDVVPELISVLPEWIFEDICDFYMFVLYYCDLSIEFRNSCDELVVFINFYLTNPHIIKNPYIQGKLVEMLHALALPFIRMSNETPEVDFSLSNSIIKEHYLLQKYLVVNILKYYVAVEHNSMSNQFYERFNTRFSMSQVLRYALSYPKHQQKLMECTGDKELFTKFALLLTNDLSYLLDESITKLREIQQIEHEMDARNAEVNSGTLTRTALDEEKESQLRALEEQATSYISLGNETVELFHTLVVKFNIVDQFLTPEIYERLSAVLNYNLTVFVGPRYTELKVKNPSKYMFEPRKLLKGISAIYLKFIDKPQFISATSRDSRSYNKNTFERAIKILTKYCLYDRSEIEGPLMRFVDKIEAEIESQNNYYEKLGGIPEEFLDPLVYTLMEDPVILPTSKVTVDRSTIRTHLLTEEHDPYNRMPLKLSEVIDNTELKENIRKWLEQRKAEQ